jgi:hypothetical protein
MLGANTVYRALAAVGVPTLVRKLVDYVEVRP